MFPCFLQFQQTIEYEGHQFFSAPLRFHATCDACCKEMAHSKVFSSTAYECTRKSHFTPLWMLWSWIAKGVMYTSIYETMRSLVSKSLGLAGPCYKLWIFRWSVRARWDIGYSVSCAHLVWHRSSPVAFQQAGLWYLTVQYGNNLIQLCMWQEFSYCPPPPPPSDNTNTVIDRYLRPIWITALCSTSTACTSSNRGPYLH